VQRFLNDKKTERMTPKTANGKPIPPRRRSLLSRLLGDAVRATVLVPAQQAPWRNDTRKGRQSRKRHHKL
jgi:hypothetical protein